MKLSFKIFFGIICLLIVEKTFSQTPNWTWATSIFGAGGEQGFEVTTDKQGNSYLVGYFSGTANFGCTTLTSPGLSNINYFIAKFDPQGACLWAKQGGGSGFDYGYDIAVDDSGNAYTVGTFVGQANFDTISANGNGSLNYFLARYNSTGNIEWLKYDSGLGSNTGKAICIDASGNINISGYYGNTITFDSIVLGLSSGNIFIARFSSTGHCLSAHGYYAQQPTDIKTDGINNIYLSGKFLGTAIFNSDTLISNGDVDGFIVKLDSSLSNVIWAKQIGGAFEDYITRIDVDSNENVFIVGDFKDTAFFDNQQFVSAGDFDGFLLKCNVNGTLAWYKKFSGTDISNSKDIELDDQGNIFIVGDFRTDLTINSNIVLSNGYTDMCVFKLDTNGSTIWIKTAGAPWDDTIDGLALDEHENLITTGGYAGSISFDGITLNASNNGSAFIAKIELDSTTSILEANEVLKPLIYPNPTHNFCTIMISEFKNANLLISDIVGRILLHQYFEERATVNLESINTGIYMIDVREKSGKSVKAKLIKN